MKKIAMTLFAGGLLLTSCSESESENFTSANTPIELSTIDELNQFTCDKSLKDIEIFVEENDASFVCAQEENGSWEWARSKSSSSKTKSSKSSSSNDRDAGSSDATHHRSSSSISPKSSNVSSTSALSSFSSTQASSGSPYVKPETIRYGLMTDERDGQIYKTVTIGTQTWMAQNLNYTPPTVFYNQTDIVQRNNWCGGKHVQNRKHGDCAIFGKLYTHAAAFDSSAQEQNSNPKQGICPNGWHVPSTGEWEQMTEHLLQQEEYLCNGGLATAMCATWAWEPMDDPHPCLPGTDLMSNNATGFTALPAGAVSEYPNSLSLGHEAMFWCSTSGGGEVAWSRSIGYTYWHIGSSAGDYKGNGYSVRCVRN